MASLVWPKVAGRKPYILLMVDGRRERISLAAFTSNGREHLTRADAKTITTRVERLSVAHHSKTCVQTEVASWVATIPDALHDRLTELGLTERRQQTIPVTVVTVTDLITKFVASKRPSIEQSSVDRMQGELTRFAGWAGGETDITTFTAGSARDLQGWLSENIKSEAGQRTCARYVKAAFSYAVDHQWLPRNPFVKLKSSALPSVREHYVDPQQAELVLAAIEKRFGTNTKEGVQWQTLFGLARYAGLRTHSETHAITWRNVDWENGALIVPVRKTRRYASERPVPIIPELMPILQAAYAAADEGAVEILTLSRNNLFRSFEKTLASAGIRRWADLFQTLRQSCETHLISLGHPQHAVSQWLGHSERVSKDHYLMVTNEAFKAATATTARTSARSTLQQPPRTVSQSSFSGFPVPDISGRESGRIAKETKGFQEKSKVARAGNDPATHGFSIPDSEIHKCPTEHELQPASQRHPDDCARQCAHEAYSVPDDFLNRWHSLTVEQQRAFRELLKNPTR
jgi:integrase